MQIDWERKKSKFALAKQERTGTESDGCKEIMSEIVEIRKF